MIWEKRRYVMVFIGHCCCVTSVLIAYESMVLRCVFFFATRDGW